MSEVVRPPESICRLLSETECRKPPLYVSKYRPQVLLENKLNKHAMRTMGPAEVKVPCPQNYLKKHAGEARFTEKVERLKGHHHICTVKRPPVPSRTDTIPFICNNIDFVKAALTKQLKTVKPKPLTVDTSQGHKWPLENSGLVPKYVTKKDYGEMPAYLQRRTEERRRVQEEYDNLVKEQREQQIGKISEEQQDALEGLKTKWAKLTDEYQRLPLVVDTISQKAHKVSLEEKLQEVENDIEFVKMFKLITLPN